MGVAVVCRRSGSRVGHVTEIRARFHVARTKRSLRTSIAPARGRKFAKLGRILNYKCGFLVLLFAYPTGESLLRYDSFFLTFFGRFIKVSIFLIVNKFCCETSLEFR